MDALAASLHCARCDYDLRTLDSAGVCPECALPIGDSVRAAAEPLAADRRMIRRAAGVLLAAMALRLAIMLFVIGYHLVQSTQVVVSSILAQLLDPWPVDTGMTCVLRMLSPSGIRPVWLPVQAAFALAFAGQCAGIALLTVRPRTAHAMPRRVAWLRHAARWSAAGSVVIGAAVRTALERDVRLMLNCMTYRPVIWSITVLPPAALIAWTAAWLFRADRTRGARWIGWSTIAATIAAAVYNERWLYERGALAWLGAAFNTAAFAGATWMWWALWRHSRPPLPAAVTMP
jgi:hypothetical protein